MPLINQNWKTRFTRPCRIARDWLRAADHESFRVTVQWMCALSARNMDKVQRRMPRYGCRSQTLGVLRNRRNHWAGEMTSGGNMATGWKWWRPGDKSGKLGKTCVWQQMANKCRRRRKTVKIASNYLEEDYEASHMELPIMAIFAWGWR